MTIFNTLKNIVKPKSITQTPSPSKPSSHTPQKSIQLKIKGCSLAQEARIIRAHEKRLKIAASKARERNPNWLAGVDADRNSLFWHRMGLKPEMRSTYLAQGFLMGKSYKSIEQKRYTDPEWDDIERMVRQYGHGDQRALMQSFSAWRADAGQPDKKPPYRARIRPSNRAAPST